MANPKMNCASAVRIALIVGIIAAAVSFVVSYSCCGILASKVLSIVYGIFLLLIFGFDLFILIKKGQRAGASFIFSIILLVLTFAGAITCFSRVSKLYTLNTTVQRVFLAVFILLGLTASISTFVPEILLKIFGDIIPQTLDYDTLLVVIGSMNLLCSIVSAIIISTVESYNENTNLRQTALLSLLTVFISAFVGAFFGVALEYRAETFGYVPSAL